MRRLVLSRRESCERSIGGTNLLAAPPRRDAQNPRRRAIPQSKIPETVELATLR